MTTIAAAPRIVVVGPAWVGDMVLAQSLFLRLKARQPDCRIDVLAPPWSAPVLARMPQVRAAIPLPVKHGELGWRVRRRVARDLRERGYHQAIVLPSSLKSALAPFWAGIDRRTGYVGEQRRWLLNDIRRLDTAALPMTVQRFVALGAAAGEPLGDIPRPRLQVRASDVAAACRALAVAPNDRPLLGLCPGAEYGAAKRWPAERFAALANHYLDRGWQVWLFGSGNDAGITRQIRALAPQTCDLAGRTDLAQAIDLMSLCTAVVSNDSGLMHVAAALARPLIAIYGASDPGMTPPLSDRAQVLRLGLPCSPCFRRDCPLGHTDCLTGIAVDAVIDALTHRLSDTATR